MKDNGCIGSSTNLGSKEDATDRPFPGDRHLALSIRPSASVGGLAPRFGMDVPTEFVSFAEKLADVAGEVILRREDETLHSLRLRFTPYGCGSKIGTQNGTLVNGTKDQNLRSPGGLVLTHTHMNQPQFVNWGVFFPGFSEGLISMG